jgi:hypothetical protein
MGNLETVSKSHLTSNVGVGRLRGISHLII